MLKVLSQQLQDTLATVFEGHPPIENFTNMDQVVEPALTILCFFFSQANLDFKFT